MCYARHWDTPPKNQLFLCPPSTKEMSNLVASIDSLLSLIKNEVIPTQIAMKNLISAFNHANTTEVNVELTKLLHHILNSDGLVCNPNIKEMKQLGCYTAPEMVRWIQSEQKEEQQCVKSETIKQLRVLMEDLDTITIRIKNTAARSIAEFLLEQPALIQVLSNRELKEIRDNFVYNGQRDKYNLALADFVSKTLYRTSK